MPILTSDLTSIVVGQSITFSVVIPLSEIPNISGFAGAYAYFNSGDGQQQVDTLGPLGNIDGGVTFTYLATGNYVASALGNTLYHSMNCDGGPCPNGGTQPGSQWFDVTENITVGIPEPATWMLLLAGLLARKISSALVKALASKPPRRRIAPA